MRQIKGMILIFFSILFLQCNQKKSVEKKTKEEILIAEHIYELGDDYTRLELYKDSSYIFTIRQISSHYEKIEKYNGKYLIDKDTIQFLEYGFQYLDCKNAVLKNNFIEFLNGKMPLKLKLKMAKVNLKNSSAILHNPKFAFFTYNPDHYDYFSENVESIDLTQVDLKTIDEILSKCIKENPTRLTRLLIKYNKQCIAVKNSKNEIEVLVFCSCNSNVDKEEFKYQINQVNDGGDCYFSVKLNLKKKSYAELNINGRP
ncbi:hypothetical protein D0809_17165 [Flavobacterium circumlabens]|uniref:Uncharacterized protein n=1 Tax=Flavobacterium circumlabens TaxID=2133765 RepID=A0A4Y7U9Q8_9FLAO|nr:hypothetical protein [Flavobacterium circumlabens]TCN55422.1 hypothetical protein EV142_106111 [Flavobacterium circumlabens]TEB43163.1 hypothetical protein D0809_17165 [Flavobacterium circumlabens]